MFGSSHGDEDAHEAVEEQDGVEGEHVAFLGDEGLEEIFVGLDHEEHGSGGQQEVEEEVVEDEVHEEDGHGEDHDGRGAVDDEAEGLQDGAE